MAAGAPANAGTNARADSLWTALAGPLHELTKLGEVKEICLLLVVCFRLCSFFGDRECYACIQTYTPKSLHSTNFAHQDLGLADCNGRVSVRSKCLLGIPGYASLTMLRTKQAA